MKKIKVILSFILVFTTIIFFSACSSNTSKTEKDSGDKDVKKVEQTQEDKNVEETEKTEAKKIKVIATLFPTYDFARQIIGDKGTVELLTGPAVEPHAYEPTPKDIIKIDESDVFIYTGEKMEPWVHSIIEGKSSFVVVDASDNIEMLEGHHHDHDHDHDEKDSEHSDDHDHDEKDSEHSDDHDHDEKDSEHSDDHDHDKKDSDDTHDEHHDHNHGGVDPHIWTDPVLAKIIVDNILTGVIKADPQNESYYRENAEKYKLELDKLDSEYKSVFKDNDFVLVYGGHFALGYLAHRYDIDHMSAYKGFSPDAEPSPKDIAELTEVVKANNVKVVYHEELVSPKVAEVISKSAGVKMLELSGLHNVSKKEFESGVTYVDVMRRNLENLKKGM